MSISKIQVERVLEDVIRTMLANGSNPTTSEVMQIVSEYFSRFPVGTPLPIPFEYIISESKSDPEKFNQALAHLAINLDVLYENALDQIDDLMHQHTFFVTRLESLNSRRNKLRAKIDDFLLSQSNTDGYFYSFSDTFANLEDVSTSLSSVYVDLASGTVTLPTLTGLTRRLDPGSVQLSSLEVKAGDTTIPYTELSSFSGGTRSLSNTFWAIEAQSSQQQEVVCTATISLAGRTNEVVSISRIEYTPYGTVPTQAFVRSFNTTGNTNATQTGFGNKIDSSTEKMIFIDNLREVTSVVLTMRKTKPDYQAVVNGETVYKYLFGAKEIAFIEHMYDNEASFVSEPLFLPTDSEGTDYTIDAVSVVTKQEVFAETEMTFYVAADDLSVKDSISDFTWIPIIPVGDSENVEQNVVRFEGSFFNQKMIRRSPEGNSDLELYAEDLTNSDISLRNPTSTIIPTKDVYRIALMTDEPLLNGLTLEEGINTTKIYAVPLDANATSGLDFWVDKLTADTTNIHYGRIDVGNGFFYGGDIGRSGMSVYVETYLECTKEYDSFVTEFIKSDSNSENWEIRILLNGRSVGYLAPTVSKSLIPWKFMSGLNHVSLLINIPHASQAYPNPYIGNVSLMGRDNLQNYGVVKLDTWNYVDIFDMTYNSLQESNVFTITGKEIVGLRKPTDNFRLRYSTKSAIAPSAVRFRADLSRTINNPNITPILHEYRMRFTYGNRI